MPDYIKCFSRLLTDCGIPGCVWRGRTYSFGAANLLHLLLLLPLGLATALPLVWLVLHQRISSLQHRIWRCCNSALPRNGLRSLFHRQFRTGFFFWITPLASSGVESLQQRHRHGRGYGEGFKSAMADHSFSDILREQI